MEKYRNQTSNLTQLIGLFEMTFEEWLCHLSSSRKMKCVQKKSVVFLAFLRHCRFMHSDCSYASEKIDKKLFFSRYKTE